MKRDSATWRRKTSIPTSENQVTVGFLNGKKDSHQEPPNWLLPLETGSGQCHKLNTEGWYTFTIIAAQPGLGEIPSDALVHTICGGQCFRPK